MIGFVMAALRFPVRYPYTFRLTADGRAYDTVQPSEAQKNGGSLISATESKL